MENQPMQGNRPSNPRRRPRSKMQIFKESYLPLLILAIAVVAIVVIVVAVSAGSKDPGPSDGPDNGSTSSSLEQEAKQLLTQAEQLALAYDYDGALAVLESFEGNIDDYPELKSAWDQYTIIKHNMVSWTADQVPNLSFHVLIADLDKALADPRYGQSGTGQYNRNFITTDEFTSILRRLYENGYVLVSLSDLYTYEYSQSAAKSVYVENVLLLPPDKKPILLTETHCNYYSYMVDMDEDGQPDADGAGFASKLCWDNGFYNEMVASDGSIVTGAFDLVPVLEEFIQLHPDFSYKGARAILAFSGYDGIFGYRITSETASSDALAADRESAAELIRHLRDTGYTMACYTYDNVDYSVKSATEVQEDIQLWQELIAPVVGKTDIMVFAWEADIGTSYDNNQKFDILYQQGYRFFMGSAPFLSQEAAELYVRHNRLMVTASNLYHHPEWFSQLFDTDNLLDLRRNAVPK